MRPGEGGECYSEEIYVPDIPKPFRHALLSFLKAYDSSGTEMMPISASCFIDRTT